MNQPEIECTPTQYRILKEWSPSYGRIAGGIFIEEVGQDDGSVKFAVRMRQFDLNKSGQWDFAPTPSNRDGAYVILHRWDCLETAKEAATLAAKAILREVAKGENSSRWKQVQPKS